MVNRFQEVITQIATRYNFNLERHNSHLQLTTDGDHWLHIEVQDWGVVLVSCYYAWHDNTLIVDPGVVLWTAREPWMVLEVNQDMSGGPQKPSSMSGSARGGARMLSTDEDIERFLDEWAEALDSSNFMSLEELL